MGKFTVQYGTLTFDIEADSQEAAHVQVCRIIKRQYRPKGVVWRRYVVVIPA